MDVLCGTTQLRASMQPEQHSGLGITSFILGMLSACLMVACFLVAGVLESQPGGIQDQAATLVGSGMIFVFFLCFVAAALGVAGLFQDNRKRVFAGLGLALSVVTVGGSFALLLLGALLG